MAFPTLSLSGTSTDDTEDTSATVNLPVGTYNVGDTIIVWAASRDGRTASSPSAGWTEFFDEANALDCALHAFWRKSDGTESGGTMTFTTSDVTKHPAFVAVFTGAADPDVTPPEAPGTAATGLSTTPDPPSSSVSWTAGEDNLAVAVVGSKTTVTASAFPTSPAAATDTWTNPASGGGGACGVHGGMFYDTARDTIDPNTFTISGSTNWITDVFWVRAASATGIDTKEKRAGVLGVARPWMRGLFPVATPDQEWRMNVGNTYGGNALSPPAAAAETSFLTLLGVG